MTLCTVHSSDHSLTISKLPFKVILLNHSNPPILYYGFKLHDDISLRSQNVFFLYPQIISPRFSFSFSPLYCQTSLGAYTHIMLLCCDLCALCFSLVLQSMISSPKVVIQTYYVTCIHTSSYFPWFWQSRARLFSCFATSGWSLPRTCKKKYQKKS